MKNFSVLGLAAFSFLITANSARADLTSTLPALSSCGGDSFTGVEKIGTVTDKANNVFTLNCVDRSYFQGEIFVKATGKTTAFGRCVFDLGANFINYEVDAQNNFKDIEWVNVKPPEKTVASRNKVQENIVNTNNDPTDKWLGNVKKYLKDNNLEGNANNRIYLFPFSPNDQTIGFFENDTLNTQYVLTPSEADIAYEPNGNSTITPLIIDPAQGVPGGNSQIVETGATVPEPLNILGATAGLALFGTVSTAIKRRKVSK